MAKVKKVETARDVAMKAQAEWDAAVVALGSNWKACVDFDRLHQEAFDLDADRMQNRFAFMLEWHRRELESQRADLAKWASRLTEDPVHAFKWADGAMESAARVEVLTAYLAVVEAKGEEVAQRVVRQRMFEGASSVSKSSGQCHNLMHQFTTAAWASLVSDRS